MNPKLKKLWIAQFLFTFGGGVMWLFTPDYTLDMVGDVPLAPGAIRYMAAAGQAYLGDFALSIGFMTGIALFSYSATTQRWMAGCFSVYFAVWGAMVGYNAFAFPGITGMPATYAMVGFTWTVALGNILAAAFLDDEPNPAPPAPRSVLSVLWLAQGIFLVAFGLLLVFGGATVVAEHVLQPAVMSDFTRGVFRIAGSYHLCLACFSFFGMTRCNEWFFKPFTWVFAFFFGVSGIISGYLGLTTHSLTTAILIYAVPATLLCAGNAIVLIRKLPSGSRATRIADALGFLPLAVLGMTGIAFLFTPGTFLEVFAGRDMELNLKDTSVMALMHLMGAFAVTLALLLIFAWMNASASVRRVVARSLTLFFFLWSNTLAWNYAHNPDDYHPFVMYMFLVLSYASFLLLLRHWRHTRSLPSREEPGWSTTATVSSWFLWILQGTFFLGSALAIAISVDGTLSVFFLDAVHHDYLRDQLRLIACYLVPFGLLSYQAMILHNDWLWRAYARVFVLLLALMIGILTLNYNPMAWTGWIFAWLVPVVLFLLGNLRALRQPRAAWLDDVPEVVDGWRQADFVPGAPMALQTTMTRRRASHLMGVGARGTMVVPQAAAFPPNEFFKPGREFKVRMRFANLTLTDDAGMDVRGAALKLADTDWASEFDMVMNTGSFCPASNLVEFTKFVGSKWFPERIAQKAIEKDITIMEGAVAGLRRAPESYFGLRFYSQIVRGWLTLTNEQFLVRYRLVPVGDAKETGQPDEADCAAICRRARRKNERRASNYLRQEFAERVRKAPLAFRFEAQFHRHHPTIMLDWYNASVEWEEATHPWCPIGEITLDSVLADEELERTRFSPGNKPESLFIYGSSGLLDPRSLGDSEVRVMQRLQRLRAWLAEFGELRFGAVADVPGVDR